MYFLRPDLIWPPIGLIGLASSLNSLSISLTHSLPLSPSLSLPVSLLDSLSLSLSPFLTPSLPISLPPYLPPSLTLSPSLQSFTTWWQYELCFKGYVRQFHKVNILYLINDDDNGVCVFVFIGRWHSQTDRYTWSLE